MKWLILIQSVTKIFFHHKSFLIIILIQSVTMSNGGIQNPSQTNFLDLSFTDIIFKIKWVCRHFLEFKFFLNLCKLIYFQVSPFNFYQRRPESLESSYLGIWRSIWEMAKHPLVGFSAPIQIISKAAIFMEVIFSWKVGFSFRLDST